ncbi:amino acid ABC transporter substrate-binding protein [Falsiruegeria mediterranea]
MRLFSLALVTATLVAGAASAQTLDRIKETKQFNIGFRTDAAPLSYLDNNDKPAGYSPIICDQIAQAIANKLELDEMNATFIPVDSKNRFDKVASGEIDLLCGAATITLSRREQVDFSIPTYIDGTDVLLPRDASGDLRQLAGKKIGMRSATTTETAVKNSFSAAGVEAQMVRFDTHPAGITALKNGEISAYFADQSILLVNFIAAGMGNDFKISGEIMTVEKHGLAMARGDADFRLLVDSVLSDLYGTGAMADIFQTALPGVEPGFALDALHMVAPTLP